MKHFLNSNTFSTQDDFIFLSNQELFPCFSESWNVTQYFSLGAGTQQKERIEGSEVPGPGNVYMLGELTTFFRTS